MDQVNGTTTPKKKQVLFSIGSYSERDERVINKISTNSLFSSATTDNEVNIRLQPTRTLANLRPASLNFVDSTPKYNTLPVRHRYKDGINVEKPVCPPSSACNSPVVEDGPIAGKPSFPPRIIDRSLSLEPDQLRHSGRVALKIAAYEGEPRTPTRLDFLPSGRQSRNSSKASSSTASTPCDDVDDSRMILQNELVATLKRSNLKKLTEDNLFQENGASDLSEETSEVVEEPPSIKPIGLPINIEITDESKNDKAREKSESIASTAPIEEPSNQPGTTEIDAVLTELENSMVESESISISQSMSEPEKLVIDEPNKVQETVELSNSVPVELAKESNDEADDIPNNNVKQLAVELGKKMTFKADVERVPEQNGIKNV